MAMAAAVKRIATCRRVWAAACRHPYDRARRRRFLLRQRTTRPSELAAAGTAGDRAGDRRRMAPIHGRRRLYEADAVAVGRLGGRRSAGLAGAWLLAQRRRRLVHDDAGRAA